MPSHHPNLVPLAAGTLRFADALERLSGTLRIVLAELIGPDAWPVPYAALLMATLPTALLAPLLLLLDPTLPDFLLRLLAVFVASAALLAGSLLLQDHPAWQAPLCELQHWLERQHALQQEAAQQQQASQIARWLSLRGPACEDFVADLFEQHGYRVDRLGRPGDQGVDLILRDGRERIAVQVKGWEGPVGNHAVMEVYAGMAFHGCNRCLVVTNSRFTVAARELAERLGCGLLDREEMMEWLI